MVLFSGSRACGRLGLAVTFTCRLAYRSRPKGGLRLSVFEVYFG